MPLNTQDLPSAFGQTDSIDLVRLVDWMDEAASWASAHGGTEAEWLWHWATEDAGSFGAILDTCESRAGAFSRQEWLWHWCSYLMVSPSANAGPQQPAASQPASGSGATKASMVVATLWMSEALAQPQKTSSAEEWLWFLDG